MRIDTALPFARSIGDQRPNLRDRTAMLAAAAKLEPGPVRDLFEGYLPPDPKGRKLGANPRPASILALAGDAQERRDPLLRQGPEVRDLPQDRRPGDRSRPRTHRRSARLGRGPNFSIACSSRPRASSRSSPRTSSARRTRRPSPACSSSATTSRSSFATPRTRSTPSRPSDVESVSGRRGCRSCPTGR